jgi:hypothetical protein
MRALNLNKIRTKAEDEESLERRDLVNGFISR